VTGRFSGFDVLNQAPHWDQVTKDLIEARVRTSPQAVTFFSATERGCAHALLNDLTGQDRDDAQVPVTQMVEARLAAGETDGWRYADMPEDGQAWRDTLGYLDADARARCGTSFAETGEEDRHRLIQDVQDRSGQDWHGLPAKHVWSLWTRYACTALYAHPDAWAEIGFPGPAYPRGYKNIGVDKLEPYEVRDADPSIDPVRKGD
jgi:gluconate 2-dehydrogenase subunit 3-like protein